MGLKRALTVAGSDSSGGAGIQADLTTFYEYGVYGFSALTTIVSMDDAWNHHVFAVPLEVVDAQLETVLQGIGSIDAVKTGMLGSSEMIELVADTETAPRKVRPKTPTPKEEAGGKTDTPADPGTETGQTTT